MNEQEFWDIWHQSAVKPQEVCYRLYHDSQGNPLFYSMEQLPGNYIEVDRETFISPPKHIKVIDGKIKNIFQPHVRKIVPTVETGTSCSPWDVTVVVPDSQPNIKWNYKDHE